MYLPVCLSAYRYVVYVIYKCVYVCRWVHSSSHSSSHSNDRRVTCTHRCRKLFTSILWILHPDVSLPGTIFFSLLLITRCPRTHDTVLLSREGRAECFLMNDRSSDARTCMPFRICVSVKAAEFDSTQSKILDVISMAYLSPRLRDLLHFVSEMKA